MSTASTPPATTAAKGAAQAAMEGTAPKAAGHGGHAMCPPHPSKAKRMYRMRYMRKQPRSCEGDMWMRGSVVGKIVAAFFAALLGGFFFVMIAIHSPDYNSLVGGVTLSPLEVAYGYLALIFALCVVFGQYFAAHLAPHVWLSSWLADPSRFSGATILRYILVLVAEFVGMLLASLFASFLVGGSTASLGCANPAAGVSVGAEFLADLFVKLLAGHIVLLSIKRHKNGPFGMLALALVISASILSLGAITGGSYSLTRYTSVAIIQGCFSTRTFLIQLANFILAGVINWLLSVVLFTLDASSMSNKRKMSAAAHAKHMSKYQ